LPLRPNRPRNAAALLYVARAVTLGTGRRYSDVTGTTRTPQCSPLKAKSLADVIPTGEIIVARR
jgi:hypothetical protein